MKHTLINHLILCIALSAASQSFALNFDEALKDATNNSHELKQLRLEAESASWSIVKARAGFMPKLELRGRHLFKEKFEELEVGFGGQSFVMPAIQPYSNASVNARLGLFEGFETVNQVSSAQHHLDAANKRFEHAEQRKRIEIRNLFYRALGSQVLYEVTKQNIETLESHLKDVNSRIRGGVSTRYDALRAEVQLEDAQTEKLSADNRVTTARVKLFEAMNREDHQERLEGTLPNNFDSINVDKLKIEEATRSDRAELIAERDAASSAALAARGHWYPHASLFADYEWYNNYNHSIVGDDERFKSAYAVGVMLNWQLFDGGSSYASQHQAALRHAVAEEKLAALEQTMPSNLEEAKRRFTYNAQNYKTKLSSIHKAEEAVRLARSGLKEGVRTNTEVLDAMVDLNRAKAYVIKSQVEAIEALGELELAIGYDLNTKLSH